jgi:4-hydroxy-3-methylbut-2-enyl diphosphate reductase
VVDATCTFVKAAQDKAARLRNEGYRVVILGEATHPEVYAIHSYAGPDALVVEDPADLPDDLPRGKVGIVVQTTQSRERLGALVQAILPRVRELRVFNTICDATEKRQEAAVALARTVELVLVVGGRNSGNTTRLAELCAAVQPNTRHIEAPTEILPEWVEGIDTVGVTAGASTPQKQIDAVVARLGQLVP